MYPTVADATQRNKELLVQARQRGQVARLRRHHPAEVLAVQIVALQALGVAGQQDRRAVAVDRQTAGVLHQAVPPELLAAHVVTGDQTEIGAADQPRRRRNKGQILQRTSRDKYGAR